MKKLAVSCFSKISGFLLTGLLLCSCSTPVGVAEAASRPTKAPVAVTPLPTATAEPTVSPTTTPLSEANESQGASTPKPTSQPTATPTAQATA